MAITISGDTPNFSAATITTVTSTTLSDGTNSTSSTNCIQGSAKAWVNFNGTVATPSTIRASYNVTSITKNATGDYTINFTNAFADNNYAVVATAKIVGGTGGQNIRIHNDAYATAVTTTTVKVQVTNSGNAALADSEMVNVAVFR